MQFLEMTDSNGVDISVHISALGFGQLRITGLDRRNDYRPLCLGPDGVRMLRDALNLALEDLADPGPTT